MEMLKNLGKQVIINESPASLISQPETTREEKTIAEANIEPTINIAETIAEIGQDVLHKETIRICEEDPEIVIEEEPIEENNISVTIQPREECVLTIKPKKGLVISYIQSFFIFYEFNFNIQYNLIGYSEDKKSFLVGVKNTADFESKISVFYRVVF
jgi:hypothetical protein